MSKTKIETKIKGYVAGKILNKFNFCWADLVSWFFLARSTKELFQQKKHDVKGCIVDSIKNGACWCGKYQHGLNQHGISGHLLDGKE